jgi:predicted nucleic acid-binding protein
MAYFIWGVLYLLVGTILFLVGAIEWKLWENPLRSSKKKRAIIYAGVVAIGALFTTKGWNEFSAYSQRQGEIAFNRSLEETNRKFKQDLDKRDQKFKADQEERELQIRRDQKKALILAVAREWKANDILRYGKPLSYYESRDYEKLYATNYILPRFGNYELKIVKTSHLFSYSDKEDMRLILPIINYAEKIERANQIFDETNNNPFLAKENKATALKRVFGENGAYATLLKHHDEVREILKSDYAWVLTDIDKITWGDPNRNPSKTK